MDADLLAAAPARAPARNEGALAALAVPVLLILELWLATRPYYGVVQDTRFYTVEALRHLDPGRFADDLYFRFGSTAGYSVFPALYAPLVALLGVGAAAMAATLVGQAAWLGGLFCLASAVFRRRRLVLLAVAAAIALPNSYPHYGYGEPFVTPRLFAEALSMAALGLLLRERVAAAFLLLAVSAAVHPLMTLPALGVALVYVALRRPAWWLVIAAGGAGIVALAVMGVAPFANLRLTFDPAWFDIARRRDTQWLITAWSAVDYCRVVGAVALGALAAATGNAGERRLLGAALAVALGGVAATLLGVDLAHNVFVAQVLPWRSLWLLTLLAQLCAVPILLRLYREERFAQVTRAAFVVALGCLFLSRFAPPLELVAAPAMAFAAALALWQWRSGRPLPAFAAAGCRAACVACVAVAAVFAGEYLIVLCASPDAAWRTVYAFVVILTALGAVAVRVAPLEVPRARMTAWAPWVMGALVPVVLLGWDVRTPWTKFVEAPGGAPPALAALLPAGASVYWEGGPEMLWLRLRRPSYFSCAQGTGAVFVRAAAIEFQRRAAGFRPLHPLDLAYPECHGFGSGGGDGRRTAAELRQVCAAEPGLDYLVLVKPVEGVAAKVWDAPAPFRSADFVDGRRTVSESRRFYVYSCAGLR